MVLKGIDPKGPTSYCPDDVCNESSCSVLTIGLPVKTQDDDIGKYHGLEDVPEKVPDNYLWLVGTEGPPCKYDSW